MSEHINLSDPAFEPTDAQLAGLSARAFAGVGTAHRAALVKLRAEIAVAREQALKSLAASAVALRNAT